LVLHGLLDLIDYIDLAIKYLTPYVMKKFLLIATALTLSISSFSQKKETSKVIIAGNLKNYYAKEIRVQKVIHDIILIPAEAHKRPPIAPIEEGNFRLILDAEKSEMYTITIVDDRDFDLNLYVEKLILHGERNRFQFFLSPGDSIYLSADFLNFNESFIIRGDNETENTYLFEKQRVIEASISGKLIDYQRRSYGDVRHAIMGLDKEQYFNKKDSIFNVIRNKFEALKADNTLDPEFIKLEEANLKYEPLLFDLDYPYNHASIHRGRDETSGQVFERIRSGNMDGIDFPIDKVNADLANVDLNRSDLLSSWHYASIIKVRIHNTRIEIMKQDSTLKTDDMGGYHKAMMMAIDQLVTNQVVKDHFQFYNIKRDLQSRGPVNARADYDKFIKDNQSPTLAGILTAMYVKADLILPGKEVPDFTFVNMEGESVKLSDLRGTLIYIDIWATWCGPCIAEHPHWDKLREEYKDKAVSFLTISVDENKVAWEKMVKAKKMEGLQWFTGGGNKSELSTHFIVGSIPRFILLDREGKIIDPSADRPSGNIRAILDQHL
jgi:thiol-disulfide isomerase/thioredoxin